MVSATSSFWGHHQIMGKMMVSSQKMQVTVGVCWLLLPSFFLWWELLILWTNKKHIQIGLHLLLIPTLWIKDCIQPQRRELYGITESDFWRWQCMFLDHLKHDNQILFTFANNNESCENCECLRHVYISSIVVTKFLLVRILPKSQAPRCVYGAISQPFP